MLCVEISIYLLLCSVVCIEISSRPIPKVLVAITSVSRNWKDRNKTNNRIHLLQYLLTSLDDENIEIHIITNQEFTTDLKYSPVIFDRAREYDRFAAYKYLDFNSTQFDYFVYLEDDSYISGKQIFRFIELKMEHESQLVSNDTNFENLLCLVRVSQVRSSFYMEDNNNEGIMYGTYLSDRLFRPKYFYSAAFILSSKQYEKMQFHEKKSGCLNPRNRHSHKIESINLGLNCAFSCMWPINRSPNNETAIDHRAVVLHIGCRDTTFRSDDLVRERVNAFAFTGNSSYDCDSTTDRLCIPANYSALLDYDRKVVKEMQLEMQKLHLKKRGSRQDHVTVA